MVGERTGGWLVGRAPASRVCITFLGADGKQFTKYLSIHEARQMAQQLLDEVAEIKESSW